MENISNGISNNWKLGWFRPGFIADTILPLIQCSGDDLYRVPRQDYAGTSPRTIYAGNDSARDLKLERSPLHTPSKSPLSNSGKALRHRCGVLQFFQIDHV